MSSAILSGLSRQDAQRVSAELVRFNHRLEDTGLFTDEALARLIDEHPREELTICTMQRDPPPDRTWIAGEGAGRSGAELVEAARRGALWVSPRHAMTLNPRYRPVFEQVMTEFARATGLRILSADAAVLVSSARMGIFFHVDPAETMLWHIRGHKTITVYPPVDETVTEGALEAILLKETLSDLPYRAEMEASAQQVALAPGEALFWPMHSPHRVVNGPDLNVSVSVEFNTPRAALTNGVFYANGWARRRLGWAPRTRGTPLAVKPAYLAVAKALKTFAPPKANVEARHERQFDVDLSAPDCIRWREGYGPQFEAAA